MQKDINASIFPLKFPKFPYPPNFFKVYERCLHDQISKYFETTFSKFQCSFRKGYGTQYFLLAMIEKWKRAVDNGGVFAASMTNLSKVFGCIPHDFMIARLAAQGFD